MSYWDDTSTDFEDDYGFEDLTIPASAEVNEAMALLGCAECLDAGEWTLTGVAEIFGSTTTDVSVDAIFVRGDDLKLRQVPVLSAAFTAMERAFQSRFTENVMDRMCDGIGFPAIPHAGIAASESRAA